MINDLEAFSSLMTEKFPQNRLDQDAERPVEQAKRNTNARCFNHEKLQIGDLSFQRKRPHSR